MEAWATCAARRGRLAMRKDGRVDYQNPLVADGCNNFKTRVNAVAALPTKLAP